MRGKNLLDHQLMGLIEHLQKLECCPMGIHSYPIMPLVKRNLPSIHSLNIRQWMAVLHAADYVVSVDTAAFHCAGGMGKPLTGIFTFARR
jgi:ADP-heptose:LPS heptosyltransferase